MKIIIDIPEEAYKRFCDRYWDESEMLEAIESIIDGTPLKMSSDGTLIVTVDDVTKVGRVLVLDDKHNGGLYYADSD